MTGVMPEEDIERLIILSTKQQLPPLLKLDLGSNNLSQLPSNFTKLSTIQPPLQELYLYWNNSQLWNEFGSITASQVCSLSHLTVLRLGACGLRSPLPPQLTQLQQLKALYLWGNSTLKTFPTTLVEQLLHLKVLHLSGIGMSGDDAIPSITLSTLTNLTHLYLNNNELTSIPNTITTLTKLKTLYIFNNKLTTIPLGIGNLPLVNFDCFDNPLVSPLDSLAGNYSDNSSSKAVSLLKACLGGIVKYSQIKLIFIGNGREGKVISINQSINQSISNG